MRVGIFGIGAIGGLFLHRLSGIESELHLLVRGLTKDMLDDRGLLVHYDEHPEILEVVPPQRFQYLDSSTTLDLVIVCGKNHDVTELTGIASQHLGENGKILFVQNGIGHLERAVNIVGKEKVLAGCVTHGVTCLSPGEIRLAGTGEVVIGPVSPDASMTGLLEAICDIFERAELVPRVVVDGSIAVWRKLLLNLAINPVASIAGVENGRLLESPLREVSVGALMEGIEVARLEGVIFDVHDLVGDLEQVLSSTAKNRCSMLQDIINGRRTEVDAICGALVVKAESHGFAVPRIETLWNLVRSIENVS